MNKNIVIIHYNTPHLTECLVRSINLFMKDTVIYIFDNSDKDPFTAKFDNVTILDNTKGQIINFEKWLEQYPNRTRSGGRVNKWASAKHCYSVEKCMEIIDDNFILLDSDVLLKKDISDLFDDSYMYIAETSLQPHSTINRILPYMCYINVKMCKENGIHYFDDSYMHGLCKNDINKRADSYDTGAGFYFHANKFKHVDIELNDYIVHYQHGSWNKIGVKNVFSQEEWLKFNKKYWSNEKNKKVIYTCITGGYDKLIDPSFITYDFDYICFTDNLTITSNVWDIRPLPKEVDGLTNVKKQRYVKINPHLLLNNYELSIWVDGNVLIKGDLNEFLIQNVIGNDSSVYVPTHPTRNCIYDEAKAVISMHKDTPEIVNPQIEKYKKEGFPKNYGLLQSNIMVRLHNEDDCIKIMKNWFSELKEHSHRDQLSFNYVLWKNKDVEITYLDKQICKSKWFEWGAIHKKLRVTVPVIKKESENKNTENKKKELKTKIAEIRNMITKGRKIPTPSFNSY